MIAHINKQGKEETVIEHCEKTAALAKDIGKQNDLEATATLTALLHDMGKGTAEFTTYIRTVTSENGHWHKEKLNHSSAGGKYLLDNYPEFQAPGRLTEQLIAWSIFSHHGVNDVVTVEKENAFERRLHPPTEIYYEECVRNFEKNNDYDIGKLLAAAQKETIAKVKKIRKTVRKQSEVDFLLGMLARFELSILIDSDRTATARFMNDISSPKAWNLESLWIDLEEKLNRHLEGMKSHITSNVKLATLRNQISERCAAAGELPDGIYTLQVPTGGGKTLAGMRFALKHARKYKKQRIFYISPFKTILEQNVQVYRSIFGAEPILEYHSDIVIEEEDENYQTLTENFDAPIVLTTMVQFLNTFFSNRTQCVRRMHAFANAVILLDEVQSIPLHMLNLFNMAMNFISACCGSTVVLCSATQPLFGETEYPIRLNGEIMTHVKELYQDFKRTTIIDKQEVHTCGEIAELAINSLERAGSGLIIVNTKQAAKTIYENLIEYNVPGLTLYHLSTNMCPKHRMDVLSDIKTCLAEHKKVLCVSTQLIEAGVDISFGFVIRSLAGWDSVIQAAGRCNRNAEDETGNIYVVNCEEETLGRLEVIRKGKKATERILNEFPTQPALYGYDLFSVKTSELYYKYLLSEDSQKSKMNYPVERLGTSIFSMLSSNVESMYPSEKVIFKQAFKEAGRCFKAIDADTRGVLVPYKEGKEIIEMLNGQLAYPEIEKQLKRAQQYTINVYESKIRQMLEDKMISKLYACDAYYLEERYFDEAVGITENSMLQELIF